MADEIEFTPDPMSGGVSTWSNLTRVLRGQEEVTVDFAIRDPLDPGRGDIVGRVTLPLGAAFDLRDALIEAMEAYTDPDHHQPG